MDLRNVGILPQHYKVSQEDDLKVQHCLFYLKVLNTAVTVKITFITFIKPFLYTFNMSQTQHKKCRHRLLKTYKVAALTTHVRAFLQQVIMSPLITKCLIVTGPIGPYLHPLEPNTFWSHFYTMFS
jgi:hypothetical protein